MTPRNPGALLRPACREDRTPIRQLLEATGLFHPPEIDVALEVLDVYLDQPGQTDYLLRTAVVDGRVAGYTCHGLNSMTAGTVELYWIAVHPFFQGQGIGTMLLENVEEESRRIGARMICSETSSRQDYGPTLAFYRSRGYVETARIPGYYAVGDDKIIFVRMLDTPAD